MHTSKPDSSLWAVAGPAIERREAPRFSCPSTPLVQATARPDFRQVSVIVENASLKGIRLFCAEPLDLDACLAILWSFGPPECWRTIRATVRHMTARSDGWIIGCAFDYQLDPWDLEALLQFDPAASGEAEKPTHHDGPISKTRTNRTVGP